MAYAHKLQSSRYELKYIIDARKALAVRDYVLNYLQPDTHTRPGSIGYPVHSLYLDSPDLRLCRATVYGEKNRFKLRLRFYDDKPDSPVFFEIKRRVLDVILKQRAVVRRSSVARLIAGHWPLRSDLLTDDDKNFKALHNFCNLRNMIAGQPAAYTSYYREAYEPADSNSFRVTFDRNLKAGSFKSTLSIADLESWPQPQVDGVILELKFTDRFPDWMHTLVQLFNLERTSMPKYVECVTVLDGSPLRWLGTRARKQATA
jgi:SPX domain protein involved in polyphosphate accumulation